MKVTFDRRHDDDKKPAVDIIFHPTTTEEIERLFKVEDELHNLGLGFDTYFDYPDKIRGWQLDWSLNNETSKEKEERDRSRKFERESIRKHAALGKGREGPR